LTGELIFHGGKVSESFPYYFNIVNTRFREKALFQIGKGYFFESQFREAITNLDILLLEFPNSKYSEEGLFIKGECLFRLGLWDRALEAYHRIIERKGRPFWQLLALIQCGGIRSSRNENDIAAELFQKVMTDFPHHPLFYHAAVQLGNLHFREKDVMEAIRYYSIVLKGNMLELLGEAYFRLGEIFYQEGKYDKAFTNFERAMEYLKDTSLWFFLAQMEIGNLQRRWGKYEDARKSYRVILDYSKDEEIKKAARELLIYVDSNSPK
jgi:tetratricopeptide (TPR) repeat protein